MADRREPGLGVCVLLVYGALFSSALFSSALFSSALFSSALSSEHDAFRAGNPTSSPVAAAARDVRYLLYDVNPPEGFNLRRDVYIRMASLVKTLRKQGDWVLVLPPWGRLYHWQSPDVHQVRIPWAEFFSLTSLQANVPVIEYEEFIAESGGPFVDQVLVLQNYAEGWTEGKWEEKVDERPCIERLMYTKDKQGYFRGWFWGYEETRALNVSCISAQGHASILAPFLQDNITAISVMLDRAETVLHDHYAGKDYWDTRRSMVFAKHLRMIGDQFRAEYLNSTDEQDHTQYNEDWTRMRSKLGSAKGGPYLGVHLRRNDFIWGHREDVPSLKGAVKKIRSLMKKNKLERVFVATDAEEEGKLLYKTHFPPIFSPIWIFSPMGAPTNAQERTAYLTRPALHWMDVGRKYHLSNLESKAKYVLSGPLLAA